MIATVTGRSEGVRVFLVQDLDGDGLFDGNEAIDSAWSSGNANLEVSASLAAGTYYIWIDPFGNDDSSRYTVSVF